MAVSPKIINFLKKGKIKYELLRHKTVYTAHDKAATLRIPEKIIGKTLVIKINGGVALVLVPANKNLDKQKLQKIAKTKSIDFVKENWMKKNLKGAKIGAIPPFGVLWPARQRVRSQAKSGGKLPTFVDRGMMKNPKIIINAGDYNWSIKISPAGLKKIIPDLIIGNFSKKK